MLYKYNKIAVVVPFIVYFYFPIFELISEGFKNHYYLWNSTIVGSTNVYSPTPPQWDLHEWNQGRFQAHLASWWEGACPGREFTYRIFNQIDYTFFASSYQDSIVIGPHGSLNELGYILDATHQYGSGQDVADSVITKLTLLDSRLKERGMRLLVVFTPSKAATVSSSIPNRFQTFDQDQARSFPLVEAAIAKSSISYVNGADIIHKQVSDYPLFVTGGVHWTDYAASIVLREVVRSINQLTHKSLPKPEISKIEIVDVSQSDEPTDSDLSGLLNLEVPLHYPTCNLTFSKPDEVAANSGPRIIFAGGSFTHQLLKDFLREGLYSKSTIYDTRYGDSFRKNDFDFVPEEEYKKAFVQSEVVVLELNETLPEKTINYLLSISDSIPIKSENK